MIDLILLRYKDYKAHLASLNGQIRRDNKVNQNLAELEFEEALLKYESQVANYKAQWDAFHYSAQEWDRKPFWKKSPIPIVPTVRYPTLPVPTLVIPKLPIEPSFTGFMDYLIDHPIKMDPKEQYGEPFPMDPVLGSDNSSFTIDKNGNKRFRRHGKKL